MPLIRKIVDVGTSKAVTIPKDWLKYYEAIYGKPIEKVCLEVNKVLKIFPLIEKKKEK